MKTRSAARLASAVLVAAVAVSVPSPASASGGFHIVWDDFDNGFSSEKWTSWSSEGFPQGDAKPTTANGVLTVVPTGTNPRTGDPAFRFTTAPESQGGGGDLDQLKWIATVNHTASSGFPGFDAKPGQQLTCRHKISGRTFGTREHPFGAAVTNPEGDLRLAATSTATIDTETQVVTDFVITNTTIFAIYERLPVAGKDHAAFTYAVPVASRRPDQVHVLETVLDNAAGAVQWRVDGRTALRVDKIGHRVLDRKHLLMDLGGREERVYPRQMACGLGMFTFLAGSAQGSPGLVRISDAPGKYFDTLKGQPTPQTFRDNQSLPSNRLWGQGARLRVDSVSVISTPK
ncbi:DUF6081 family protein [Actinokineospora globicatena]|uniref:DUF6081 family protein n=1 Tax=Actinokineospora globicatena TaxID=103729 RepID=UPI0020A256C9|nr:DUF6081 family protein [Actinokineospora globicatena]MCP2306075.1 hypothetical protein [Actinokineospora globicatena]GLW80052.1 hypothetical protein Aglo01_45330 [Actinokineospora globicatena]GLW86881.1 hypothetical protein Aglo02_45200 [Actinokineospora globicatena]